VAFGKKNEPVAASYVRQVRCSVVQGPAACPWLAQDEQDCLDSASLAKEIAMFFCTYFPQISVAYCGFKSGYRIFIYPY
jgi:hypothetical protein